MTIFSDLLGNRQISYATVYHSGEIFELWQHLVMRYDIRELTDIFQNFAKDVDLKLLLTMGLSVINAEIEILEKQMDSIGVPLPPRPPKSINTPGNTEVLRDELMFRTIYKGIQDFLSEHLRSLLVTQDPKLTDIYLQQLKKELSYFTNLTDYGRLKGWLFIPPSYTHS